MLTPHPHPIHIGSRRPLGRTSGFQRDFGTFISFIEEPDSFGSNGGNRNEGFNTALRSQIVRPDHLFLLIGDHTRSHEEEKQSCTSGHVQVQIFSQIFKNNFPFNHVFLCIFQRRRKKLVLASNKQDLRGPEETHQHRHLEDSIL